MARILSDETTLSRQRRSLSRETRVLRYLLYGEAGLAAVLLAGGGVTLALKGRATLLWTGAAVGFLAAGHFLKTRQNEQQQQFIRAGQRGESEVSKHLAEQLDHDYYLYNDLTVRSGFRRAQIDHLVVCRKGIFVIETKNWRGRIVGDEEERSWLQYRSEADPPRPISNPVMQNRRHVVVLESFLRSGGAPVMPIVPLLVFTSRNATMDIRNQRSLLLWPAEVADYIARYRPAALHPESAVDAVLNRLQRCV